MTDQLLALNPETCWEAVMHRDTGFDGRFFYGVMTTGVYCRPSCASRQPLRKNVRFYATAAEAEADGLRACLRCHPLAAVGSDPNTQRIEELCRYIEEHAEEPLSLENLAAHAGLSMFHLQRTFKAIVGVTPKHYIEARRVERLKQSLRHSKNVTEAIYDAGFGSSSRVYERADTRLGMTPQQYRDEGRHTSISYVSCKTALGLMMLGATDRGICFLQFGDAADMLVQALKREYPQAAISAGRDDDPELVRWLQRLNDYLAGAEPRLDLPLDIRATAFQMKVWNYLQQIPYASVESYGEVAAGIGQPEAARAVARACASNQVALVIPCHRVIRSTGELGGYKWGLERKRVLIDRERASK